MRIGNLAGRLVVFESDSTAFDVADASGGRFGPAVQPAYDRWDELREWVDGHRAVKTFSVDRSALLSPVPAPRQVFAVGLNYDEHVAETGFTRPKTPTVFTKYVSSFAGPEGDVVLPEGGNTDWEVELVAVVGRTARHVLHDQAWAHVAGLALSQDLSERLLQMSGPAPQYGVAKSYPGFSPIGPWVASIDEFARPDSIDLGCRINDDVVQVGNSEQMIFSIPDLIVHLSSILTLYPGDVVFTGTPSGVGMGRSPQRWLRPGDELHSWATGLGSQRQHFIAEPFGQRVLASGRSARGGDPIPSILGVPS